MATRIRTLNFLPDIFKTPTNAQFLKATLDQIVDQPNTKTIQGYIGSKFGYGINPKDYYVTEPNKTRTDYQLEPGVVFTKTNESVAQDFISYPGILDALKLENGLTANNNRLFNSQYYSWDSFTNLDKIINYNQYYWLPNGPKAVVVTQETVFNQEDYIVNSLPTSYQITDNPSLPGTNNPVITLLRGGTYTFEVNQDSAFWIQGVPGITGYSDIQTNLNTREILGVTNNGISNGTVTFQVPFKNAQDEFANLPGNNTVGVVTTLSFDDIDGAKVNDIGGIDGITALDGLTVLFYNNGVYDASGDNFYTISLVGLVEDPIIQLVMGAAVPTSEKIDVLYGTEWVGRTFYKDVSGAIQVVPYLSAELDTLYYQDGTNSNKVGVIKLIDSNITNTINVTEDILGQKNYTASNGVVFTNGLKVTFQGDVIPQSYLQGEYYVEGVGTAIELIAVSDLIAIDNFTQTEYLPFDIAPYDLSNYDANLYVPKLADYITIARNSLSKNAWSRSNRWFHIDVIKATAEYHNDPALLTAYATQQNKAARPIIEFYPNLKLFNSGTNGKSPIDFIDFRTSNAFTQVAGKTVYYPDVTAWTSYPGTATISPLSGSNIVTTATATTLVADRITCTSTAGFKYGDRVVFSNIQVAGVPSVNFGTITQNVDYYIAQVLDSTTFTISQTKFGAPYNMVNVVAAGNTSATVTVTPLSTTITVPTSSINNTPKVGQYIADDTLQLPNNAQIISISGLNTATTTIQVGWNAAVAIAGTSTACLSMSDSNLENYMLFDGARIVFANDDSVKNKIFVTQFAQTTPGNPPIIALFEASDGDILDNDQVVSYRGYFNEGKDFYYNDQWILAQEKLNVNQPPLFDVYDSNGISFGDRTYYSGSSFSGSKLFAYGIGTGTDDVVLNFPLRYSSIDNIGDISFDVSFNSDTFDYVVGTTPITQKINTGYVHSYYSREEYNREIGWQTAVSDSIQYQLFEFTFDPVTQLPQFSLDVLPVDNSYTNWPIIQVYANNNYIDSTDYTVTTSGNNTIVSISNLSATETTIVNVLILSTRVSDKAYYTVPINLANNPFNADPTQVNVGDIRGQYQSIFYNNPNTSGDVFGANNYRDLGNIVPYGNRIIQNSASLVLPGAFLRKQNHNFFNSVEFNSRSYVNFKSLLIDTINNTEYSIYQSPASILDDALDQITTSKSDSAPFFWSDMLPSKAPYVSNTYSFNQNALTSSIYPLSKIYDFNKANYDGILVYLVKTVGGLQQYTQLVRNIDYVVSETAPSLTVNVALAVGDQIIVNEYNQTYGSYVPNTPTKLGLYPSTVPSVVLDNDLLTPTYFIRGHDGSYNKLYGDYDAVTGRLVDFRDQALLEFEKRIYNNLKINAAIPVEETEVIPGFWRETDYSNNEILQIYSELFLNWVGQNRIDYKSQTYVADNFFTYNYWQSGNKINKGVIEQGNWRGIYDYYFDTTTVNSTPWEMVGYTNKPAWWENRYGPAPYTSDNLVLWNDLAQGIDYNDGAPIVKEQYVRPGLLDVLPVNSEGSLLSPLNAIVGNYVGRLLKRDWKVGDSGPAEFSYRRSSSWPFDLMKILALTKPAKFFNLGVDLDNYKYNAEFNQYLVNDRRHLIISDIEIYGSGTAKTSYINWIVDYEKQLGIDATTNIKTLLNNLDVRLVYRLAGFSDKNILQFFVEKSVPSSRNASLLIPDESYSVLLYDNQPFDRIIYSGVVVQRTSTGYAVYGNSQTKAYFTILTPQNNGKFDDIVVENVKVSVPTGFTNEKVFVPYGTEFSTIQEVSTFLTSYGAYLTSQGMTFNEVENGLEVTWKQMVAEFLYWSQLGWEVGSITTLNPAATTLNINKDGYVVQPLTITNQNFVLNQNLYPIQSKDLNVVRDETSFLVQPLNQGDTIGYGQFNIGNFEHGIVFDNTTLFNDTIYNLSTGLKQNRIYVRGSKTAEWNGTIDAAGFILNQDNVSEWNAATKYTTGSIVKYKNKYWIATKIVQPKEVFQESEWKETDYNEIQKGLLPNSSTNSYESTLYYDVNKANLEKDADLLSFSLIGFRPRDYMSIADLSDITQVNLYQNMIKNKGTRNAVDAFKGAQLPQGGIDYDVYENWAIKSAEFGGTLGSNFIEMKLSESLLTGNPAIVALTDGVTTVGAQQEIPTYSLFNYNQPITNANVLPTLPASTPNRTFMDAGYVNLNDVKLSSYYYAGLPNGTNKNGNVVRLNQLYVRDYVWVANYLSSWQILTPQSLGQVVFVKNNLNNTATITFAEPHNLSQYDIFAIVNFNDQVDGYYLVALVVDPYKVIINLDLNPSIRDAAGEGIGFRFQSQRVATPSEISNLPLVSSEFTKSKVWVDQSSTGGWAVYEKSINYKSRTEFTEAIASSYGSAVCYSKSIGYLVSDADLGKVYRYTFNELSNSYNLKQELGFGASFGSTIAVQDNLVAISEPTGTPRVHLYEFVVFNNSNVLVNNLSPKQTLPAEGGSTNWGKSIAISGDKKWIYVSAPDLASVYVYRLSPISNEYELMTTDGSTPVVITVSGLVSADNFGWTISTDHYGETVVVGAPNVDYDANIDNWGKTYVFNRIVQNFLIQVNTPSNSVQLFSMSWDVGSSSPLAVISTSAITNAITVADTSILEIGTPVIFPNIFAASNLSTVVVYYVVEKTPTTFKVSLTKGGTPVTLGTGVASPGMAVWPQLIPLTVTVNGIELNDNKYVCINDTIIVIQPLVVGDLLQISGQTFKQAQVLTTENTPRIGVQFGYSVDTNTFANEILVGAPFDLDDNNAEGAVYRFTNAGEKYGSVTGTNECLVTNINKILINGFQVLIPTGSAANVASAINNANIPNVMAIANPNNTLTIELIDKNLGVAGSKLSLIDIDDDTLTMMGITTYTKTQTIKSPHKLGSTQFGKAISLNEQNSLAVSAPTGTRYVATTFDFTDDDNLDNDTVFDNNATQWVDSFANAGAAYIFDYLANYDETLNNTGKYTFAQTSNDNTLNYGLQPYYGTALSFTDNVLMVGTPNFKVGSTNGKVNIFSNNVGKSDWSILRQSSAIVDIDRVENIQLFSAETNNTLENLDYIDPLQGKLLGVVRENLDFISNVDPAGYNVADEVINSNITTFWGADQVGKLWFNTRNVRFLNYHQNDTVYNSEVWGKVFIGSDVAVYSWVSSNVPPALYTGPGTPFDITQYSVQYDITPAGSLAPVYFYWVRNTNLIFTKRNKTLSDTILESYIAAPKNSGISYMAPLLPNTFAIYNAGSSINANDSVLHIGYTTGNTDEIAHSQYDLIRANFADDFLPGFPGVANSEPTGLYDRLLDSLSGVDETGAIVPNPYLPKAVQTGILARPRQSFFVNRLAALKNYLQYANEVLAQFPISEIRNPALTYLVKTGQLNPSTDPDVPFYVTSDYWQYINWWAPGYDDTTKSVIQVPFYADLATLNVAPNTIVRVAQNNRGFSETYIYTVNEFNVGNWERIGLTNGTIKFNASLWDYQENSIGFGDNFFDTALYDQYPSEETRYIVRALNEQIFIDELLIYRNRGLITLFNYIQTESLESQNYLPWLNKTSFIDVYHTLRQLKPYEVFQSDNQGFLSGYINEVKPYHVVIKEFVYKYTGEEVYGGEVSDFDLPAQYNSSVEQFTTPMLVNNATGQPNQYVADSEIWSLPQYNQWFNNRGVGLIGQDNYIMTVLSSYVALNSTSMVVDNAFGFPVTGIVTIGSEKIAYNSVDRNLNLLTGLVRAVDGTTIANHYPGDPIYMDLPAVIVLDSGRAYTEPPKVSAYVDTTLYPAPIEPAQLQAVMAGDSVIAIEVINPGKGYAVTPEIVIENSVQRLFTSEQVNIISNTIQIFAPDFQTGDLVQYIVEPGTEPVGGLQDKQWYYINVLETVPTYIIGLYKAYDDAIKNQDRIEFYNSGSGEGHSLCLGAKASCITTASPIRENNITLRFDRTTYDSQLMDWESGRFYGAFFVGETYNNGPTSASSVLLSSTQPSIDQILASKGGLPFEITNVENEQVLKWSTLARTVVGTTASNNSITLQPVNGFDNSSGSTVGFYVGMPIYFNGDPGTTNLEFNTIYYVWSIISNTEFTISTTVAATSPVTMVDGVVGSGGLSAITGSESNSAVVTINYPGILNVTNTQEGTNYLTVPLNSTGTGGTSSMYVGIPVFFTGNVFGGIVENNPYYVTTIVDSQRFTISSEQSPTITNLSSVVTGTNQVIVDTTNGFSVNDPIIVTDMLFNAEQLVIGDTYVIQELSTTDWSALGYVGTPVVGGSFVASASGEIISAGSFVVGNAYRISTLGNTDWNAIGYTGIPVVGGTFIATGVGSGTGSAINGLGRVSGTNFGGIESGVTYYIRSIIAYNIVTLTTTVNGPVFTITDDAEGSATVTNQKSNTKLTTASGNMTVNVSLPVSPGQINGQKFTFYNTSTKVQNPTKTFTPSVKDISATIGNSVNIIALADYESGLNNVYVNMPFKPSINYNGLVTTNPNPYYVTEKGNITINVTETKATGNRLVCDSVASLYVNMPIIFSQVSLGALNLNFQYFVKEIFPLTNEITLSITQGGAVVSVSNQIASSTNMLGTGSPYVKLSTTMGGSAAALVSTQKSCTFSAASPSVITLSSGSLANLTKIKFTNISSVSAIIPDVTYYVRNSSGSTFNVSLSMDGALVNSAISGTATVIDITEVNLTQTIPTGEEANIDVSYVLGGYRLYVCDPGQGYAVGNTFKVTGDELGGTTPTNDLTITVTEVNNLGELLNLEASGTPINTSADYYLQVISPNKLKVYYDSVMTAPVSGVNFGFNPTVTTTILGTDVTGKILASSYAGFAQNDSVVFTGYLGNAFGGLNVGQTYYITNVPEDDNFIEVSTDVCGTALALPGDISASYTMAKQGDFAFLQEPFVFNASLVKYNNRVYICLVSNNDSEFVFKKWQLLDSGDRRLNALDRVKGYYEPTSNMPGNDLAQIFEGIEYPGPQYVGNPFAPDEQYALDTILLDPLDQNVPITYDIVGETFTAGYAPEELVPGVVSDSVTMTVATRPGTNWSETIYQNVGYFTISANIIPTSISQVEYSFYDLAQIPQQVRVAVIDKTTGLSRTLIGPNTYNVTPEYTVDWVRETITLSNPIYYVSPTDCDILRIDVYEAGNGDQLVRASTNTDAIRPNTNSGWGEIFVNCNYTGFLYEGSGVIRPNTESIQVRVLSTESDTDIMYCEDVSRLILNEEITFQGNLFGGVQENTSYYVKTKSEITNSITISDQILGGIAGPTFALTDGTSGATPMFIISEAGSETTWSMPIVYWNGKKLNLGVSRLCTQTSSIDNSITCNSTTGLVVGMPIAFDANIFGVLESHKVYYVKSIVDGNQFTVSNTVGGATITLTTAYGASYFITNDYAIGRQPNQYSAKLMLAGKPDPANNGRLIPYDQEKDYITYSLFGETMGEQYGGTIPETQYFAMTGGTTFSLANYVQGTNADSAVVEVDGVRLINGIDYTINTNTSEIELTSGVGNVLAVTTFMFTARQYFNTQLFNDATSPSLYQDKTVSAISNVETSLSPYMAQVICTATASGANTITCISVTGIVVGATVQFKTINGATIGNIKTDGTVYWVVNVNEVAKTIQISETSGGSVFALASASGFGDMIAYVGGLTTVRVTTSTSHNLLTNDLVRIDGVAGSTELNNQLFYVHKISDTIVDLYESEFPYNPLLAATNFPVTNVTTYIGNGFIWKNTTFVVATTMATGSVSLNDSITCLDTSGLVIGTPITFIEPGVSVGDATIGGLTAGTTYYVKTILSNTSFTVSTEREGTIVELTDTSALEVYVSQWQQSNVDRLWVTINGYRVPSTSLSLNANNELGILTNIATTDKVVITSMIPTATPNEQVYLLNVNKEGVGTVSRANTMTRTWVTDSTPETITVYDATRITDTIHQTVTVGTPAVGTDYVLLGLNGDKDIITQIIVYNNTTGQLVDPQNYSLVIEFTAPKIKVTIDANSGVSTGDNLLITEVLGNLIYLNGEYIRFGSIDLNTGVLSDLTRGVNGTGVQPTIPKYSEVFGLLSDNRMSNVDYGLTWNSSIYNAELGDPLQISNTNSAKFLNIDIT